jgi:hypothetical protein
MVIPFGISLGDFIAVGNLVYLTIQALGNSRGSSTDYQDLITSLSSLGRSVRTTAAEFLSLSFEDGTTGGRPDVAAVNGIKHELACCKGLLEDFLLRCNKFTETLLPGRCENRIKSDWRKVTWHLWRKDDVQRLHRDLQTHVQAFQLYAFTVGL